MRGPFPQVVVEVAFVADPYSTSLVWTDITNYADVVSPSRGRNYELGQNAAGVLSVTLRNFDGRFDPTNVSSPYYPYVIPYRPIRVRAVWQGVTYGVWTGYVERWPQQWSLSGTYGTVTVTAVDGFKALQGKQYGLRYFEEVQQDLPAYLFRFTESQTTARPYVDAQGSGNRLLYEATAAPLAADGPSLVTGSVDPSRSFVSPHAATNASESLIFTNAASTPTAVSFAGDFTIEFLASLSTVPTDNTTLDYLTSSHSTPVGTRTGYVGASFAAGGASYTCALLLGAATVAMTVATTVRPVAGRLDQIILTRSGTTISLIVNGTTLGTISSSEILFFDYLHVGYLGTTPAGVTLLIDELALYATAVSMSRQMRHLTAATVPQEFPVQFSGARVAAVLDSIGWPKALRSIEFGVNVVQASGSLGSQSALTVAQATADSELGNVFIDGNGRFVFHARDHRTHDASVATFGEGAAPSTDTNLATNPSFETGTTGWSAAGTPAPALSSTTARARTGTKSMLITWAAGATFLPDAAYSFATTPGQTYTASTYVYIPTGNPAVQPYIYGVGFRGPTTVWDAWTRINYTFIAGGTSATFGILPLGTPTAGQVCYVDSFQINTSVNLGNYIDGDQPGCAWTGTPHASTSTGPSDPEIPYLGDLQIDFDDTYLYNDIQITQANQSPPVIKAAADLVSQQGSAGVPGGYGIRTLARTVAVQNADDAAAQAATLLSWYKDPRPRIGVVTIDPLTNPSAFTKCLSLEIGDLVTVKRRPIGAAVISLRCFIDGIRVHLSSGTSGAQQWQYSYMLTPQYADPYLASWATVTTAYPTWASRIGKTWLDLQEAAL